MQALSMQPRRHATQRQGVVTIKHPTNQLRKSMTKMITSLLIIALLSSTSASAQDAETKTVKARTLDLNVPKSWILKESQSKMRVAEFEIPATPKPAELVVFYFGGPTGGVKANVERWIGQFDKADLDLNMHQGECAGGRYILVDTKGTWNKPDGPPFASKTIATPNSHVLNVIVIEQQDGAEDYYFMKLSGHKDAVSDLRDVLRSAIQADPETERTFELKDAR